MVDAEDTQTPNWDLLPSKGRLYIKIIEARNLWTPNPSHEDWHPKSKKPYCVVQFDKNEFVTREALSTNILSPEAVRLAIKEESQYLSGDDTRIDETHGCWMSPVWKHEASFDIFQADSEVTISIWDRSDGTKEVFLGMLKIRPPMVNNGKVYDHWFKLMPRQWKEPVYGDVRIQLMFKSMEVTSLSPDDFTTLRVVGKGSFGKVVMVKKNNTGRVYAMKSISKKHIIQRQEVVHTLSERNVLILCTSNPFCVGMRFSFQTPEKLYFLMDYMNGGELFYHLQRETVFTEEQAKFYSCELICALEFLHKNKIIYRDLKPENVLFDSNGHVVLADFGLCKENMGLGDTTGTFCGTAAYLAPEIVKGEQYGMSVDWWALGILFYEMVTGLPPYYSENMNLMYKKILHNQLLFPVSFSKEAEGFVRALLDRNPETRLGSGPNDAADIKQHPYLASVDWICLEKKQLMPPFKPQVDSETDTTNFDPMFTDLPPDSLPNNSMPLSATFQEKFEGFSFQASVQSIRLE
ncbi:serine/threonine-protein kinase SCH9 [Rhizoclosmatium globosum]|uniref:Serine/threonine-protein kinase SCH9 n=1 Tax=Rhizoclosmatium globosum TaxID=329046 RepID=A0A1Y2C7Y3_9FUNG|nr:hypothetical protein HDU99_007315 [Rhizoclosmatium hyalinum]KAJ3291346.1 hypothetical protein HDU79_002472 [Rhizoclosmatium sp. JEL0117]ORY43142.1 serine/threonine-protein kinase SCH9 [Rhizoclosmatium globosum]|eukprot:ORY43142.1 serine/threonine-protein kinase SCH9 [Rhizoclosmatium globosum]